MEHKEIDFRQFLNKTGKVNTRLVLRHKEYILANTVEYDWLGPSLGQRVRLKIESPINFYCDCGERLSWNNSIGMVFKPTCKSLKCSSKKRDSFLNVKKFKETITNRKYKNEYNIIDQKNYIENKLKNKIKPNYILSNKSEDIVLYISSEAERLKLSKTEYCFRLVNGISLTDIVHCFCGKGSSNFVSFELGYRNYCNLCKCKGSSVSKVKNRLEKLRTDLEIMGYTLLSGNGINELPVNISHNKCGNIFEKWMNNGRITNTEMCPKCFPKIISSYEYRLIEEIRSFYNGEIIQQFKLLNTKNKNSYRSIDIYLPEYSLGIEVNGLYWHTDNENRHISKLEKANNLGIQLMQITDKDIDNKLPIIISMIKHKIGLSEKIGARKTLIKEVDSSSYREFVEKNHIQGYASASIKLGLFLNEKLVSIFSISKSRFKKDEYEIIRHCALINHTVVGGLSKYKKYFSINYPEIDKLITFADRSYGNGNSYNKVGMTFKGYTKPNYWYLDNNYKLYSRQEFQKHKLKGKLAFYDDTKTEKELMEIAGYRRYYDCGNTKYELNLR